MFARSKYRIENPMPPYRYHPYSSLKELFFILPERDMVHLFFLASHSNVRYDLNLRRPFGRKNTLMNETSIFCLCCVCPEMKKRAHAMYAATD